MKRMKNEMVCAMNKTALIHPSYHTRCVVIKQQYGNVFVQIWAVV